MEVQDWLGKDNQLGIDIWTKKYRYENETFEEWLERVSGNDDNIKQLILEKKFLFGGRILANRGLAEKGKKITYSNCYVVTPPEDNIESIYEAAAKLARTYSYGGGCGIDISNLAPKGAKVNNAAEETSGAVSFMDTFSQVTEQIGQNGRRGALMITLDCDHPDLIEFMDVKRDLNKVTKANISVKFTDEFMEAVRDNKDYTLNFFRPESNQNITKTINARDTFLRLAKNNWQMAEPGCLFWDRIKSWNLVSEDPNFKYASTNPCAEEPLPAGGSCLLGSLNLAAFVDEDGFNWQEFNDAVEIAVLALNDILDEGLPLHPLEEQRNSVRDWRQIGLGIMGLADALIKLKITYGSPEALAMCDQIGRVMARTAIETSSLLAYTEGPYPKYSTFFVMNSKFFIENTLEESRKDVLYNGLRNSQLLTIAPTGSISTMLGISGGIEPIYANSYTRKTESLHGEDKYYKVYTPIVQEYMNEHNCKEEDLPEYFITAKDLNYKQRIDMQAVWQKHIDASISSTVNVPNEFSIMDTFNLYLYAWEKGLKGVTIYRDGCERTGILSENAKTTQAPGLARGEVIKTNDSVFGQERHLTTGCGSLHCQAYFDEDENLMETYLSKGSTGGCNSFMVALSRMISLAARGGISQEDIIDQLMSTPPCVSYCTRRATKKDTSQGTSCPMAVAYALKDMIGQEFVTKPKIETPIEKVPTPKATCPECGGELIFEGGCNSCKNCGWTKCD